VAVHFLSPELRFLPHVSSLAARLTALVAAPAGVVVQILVLFHLFLVSRCCGNEVMPVSQLQWFEEVRDGEGGFHGYWRECVQMQRGRNWCRCWWLPLLLYSSDLATRTGAETLL